MHHSSGANRDGILSRKRREHAVIADPLDEQLPETRPNSVQKLRQTSAVNGVLCLQSSGMPMASSGFQPFCVGASPPSRAGPRHALPAVPPPTSMDTHIPQPETYAPAATPPASAGAANLLPTLQMQNFLPDQAGRQQAHMGLHRQDSFCNESPSHYLTTVWRQGLQWLADSQANAQKILLEYEAGYAVQPSTLATQHVQDLNNASMHQKPPTPPQHSSSTLAQVPIGPAPPGVFSHTPTVAKGAQHWATNPFHSEDQMHSTHPQQGHMLSSAQTWSAPAAAALESWEEAVAADLVLEPQPNCNGLQAQKNSNSTSWQAGDPICNRGDSMTNSYGQDSNLHTSTDLVAAQAAYARVPMHLPESTHNVVNDDADFDLQTALAMSLAQFETEDILRTTAECLPVKRQNGGGHVWQNEKDPTVIEGQEPSSTAEEVQKLQKASDPDSNDSYETPGAQPTSPHTSCDPQMRDAGLIDALNDLSLEELKSFGLDKPFDDSKLTAEVVHRLKALRLERQAAPGGNHGSTLPESGVCKEPEDGLMDYWYDSEDAPYEYASEIESECEQATNEVSHEEVEIASGDWVDVVSEVAEAPNGNASKPCIMN